MPLKLRASIFENLVSTVDERYQMAAAYFDNFDNLATGTLPSGWVGFASPTGTAGNALVSEAGPIFGTKSFAFTNCLDGMAERYTSMTTANHGIVYAQRIRLTNGSSAQAGALVGASGQSGYFCYVDPSKSTLLILRVPEYSLMASMSLSGLGRPIADNDILWYRAERLASSGTVRYRVWLDGQQEPSPWGVTIDNDATGSPASNCGLRITASVGTFTTALDAIQIYDLDQLTAPFPVIQPTGDTTATLYSPRGTGGSGLLNYQWLRAPSGQTLAAIPGATDLLINDSDLQAGTTYDYAIQVSDTTGATATSPILTLKTSEPVATITGVSVSPATVIVTGAKTQQFAATVIGTNSPSQNVTWATSAGSITATGLLTVPASLSIEQTLTVTANSTADVSKVGAATLTVPPAGPIEISPITVASADGIDLIDYPAPTAGIAPILGVALLVGTSSGAQSSTPVAMNPGVAAGRFTHPCGGYFYTVVAITEGSLDLSPTLPNEVQGAIAPRGQPTTYAQTMAVVRNVLSTFFPLDLLVGLNKLKAEVLEVDVKTIAGSDLAATNLRDEGVGQAISQATLDAFGAVAATQLETKLDAVLPPSLLEGLAKLQAGTLDVNVVQLAGSSSAASKFRDEELSQTISTAAVSAIGAATAANLAIPSLQDTASAVWNFSNRALSTSSPS